MSSSSTSEFQSSVGGVMIRVPAGSFMMGSPESEDGHRVWEQQREVTFSNDFSLGKTPVTQEQYAAVTGENPTDHERIGDAPVDSVTWGSANDFCQKLTQLDRAAGKLPDGWEYRLPTEAEWDYACRAGSLEPHMASRGMWRGIMPMPTTNRTPSVRRRPMRGGFMTCSAMSGNGVRTGSGATTDLMANPIGPFAVGAISAVSASAVRPSAGACMQIAVAALSAFDCLLPRPARSN
jgi:hypothetical protein